MKRVFTLGALVLAAGLLGACDSSHKTVARTEPIGPPTVAPTGPEAAPIVASTPAMPEDTAVIPPTMDLTGPKTKVAAKPDVKVDAKIDTKADPAAKLVTAAKQTPGEFYLTIVSVKSETIAKSDAAFLVKHGISATVVKSGTLYKVESVDGFAKSTTAEAKAFKAKVIAAGKEFPGASKTKGAWDDAYFQKAGGTATVKTAAKPKATKTDTTTASK